MQGVDTEIPLWRSISIKSLVAPFLYFIIFYGTCPVAPQKEVNFSVMFFQHQDVRIIPKVLLRCISSKALSMVSKVLFIAPSIDLFRCFHIV
jgi:hypothetical protein